jgi:hypothetical protein
MFLWYPVLDLARAPRRTARKKGSGYENGSYLNKREEPGNEVGGSVRLYDISVLPFLKSKFLIFVIKISLNSLDCICYFLENSLKFHEAVCSDFCSNTKDLINFQGTK